MVGRRAVLCVMLFSCAAVNGEAQVLTLRDAFGKLEGPLHEVFGLVEDAAFIDQSLFAVLDSRMQNLRLVSEGGTVVASTGRAGRGPGEYFVPAALAVGSEGLLVLDRGNARITVYSVDTSGFSLLREIPVRFQAWDICAVRDRIYLATDAWDTPIAEIASDGTVVRKFGEAVRAGRLPPDAPQSLHESLEYKSRVGNLDCSDLGLTWASSIAGKVMHYSLDGQLLAAWDLPGFEPVLPRFTARRTVQYGPRDGVTYVDDVENVTHVVDQVVVQATRTDFALQARSVMTWIVSPGTAAARPWPEVGVWLRDAMGLEALLSREDPFPQVLVGTYGRQGGR